MKILVFGNPLVEEDSLPLRLLPRLRKKFTKIEFREFDSSEDLHKEGRDLVILDTVKGIKKAQVIEDIGSIILGKAYSLHDFDLGYNLKLLKKIGTIDSVKIIAVPASKDGEEVFTDLVNVIERIFH
ncbi:hypothetical protein A3K63_05310 [Candidatus Micrarchaeota archaeon RBG_16_49_10]|nr:MAG: hypothetical protein A3K63_05310 [Candidatus Micrarchaeota archaeon RBG_16_49_10]